ncbi:MAG: phosphorylase family protein [Paracoccaceae bacterium]
METHLGIIGGSGLYDLPIEAARSATPDTPWGAPAGPLTTGTIAGRPVTFVARHGPGHAHAPDALPSRATVAALKAAGVTDVLAISAVGSLNPDMAPGDLVLVDDAIDRTWGRPSSFFGTGCVAHVSLARPTCPRLSDLVAAAVPDGARLHRGGTYLAMQGPQFSTRAESLAWQAMGADVIGMTMMPEARLMREAEICYAALAMVTDFDCWHPDHDAVDVAAVIATLSANAQLGRETATALPALLKADHVPCPHRCDRALDHAVITAPEARDPAMVAALRAVAARVL